MGQFSWLDCVTGSQVVCNRAAAVYVLVPDEFSETYGKHILETCYDGYGRFGGYDIYDLIADWNKDYIDPDTFTSRALEAPREEQYSGLFYTDVDELRNNGATEAEIEEKINESRHKQYEIALNRYNLERQRLRDFCSGISDAKMKEKYGEKYKRLIGINIACYDEDNVRLRYPIKITHSEKSVYEYCAPSMSDPYQGWT